MYLVTISIFFYAIALSNGALVLSRYGYASSSYYYGTVRVYYNGWGNICDDSSYSIVKLMSFVISWDILESLLTLELD